MAVTADVLFAMMAVLGPETCVHAPVPVPGVLAAMVAVVRPQNDWLGPAFETVGGTAFTILTVLVEGVQSPLEILHWNT